MTPRTLPNTFCVFILSHGRPNNVITLKTLEGCGYHGRVYIVVDDEDSTVDEYRRNYGAERVLVFNKQAEADLADAGFNSGDRRVVLMARNACFRLAEQVGATHFMQFDDDYYYFGYRFPEGAHKIRNMDAVLAILLEFYMNTPTTTVAFAQGGDHIGGFGGIRLRRKAMNSFLCSTERPFRFVGFINEDVNTYALLGSRGQLFFTFTGLQLDQRDTQSQAGGMGEFYKQSGTYYKSFMPVMMCPSSVSVVMMQTKHQRLHHRVDWARAVPCIVPEQDG